MLIPGRVACILSTIVSKLLNMPVAGMLVILLVFFIDSKNVPALRVDYEKVTGQSVYPFKMCSHRWVEYLSLCERAIALPPSIV